MVTLVVQPDKSFRSIFGERQVEFTGSAVDVVNVSRLQVVSRITSLGAVYGPAVSPDGKTLLLPNTGNSQAAAVNQSTAAVLADIPIGAIWSTSQLYLEYGGAAVSPDGTRAYVTNYSSSNVSIIDTASKKVVKNVTTDSSPVGVVVSPDNSKAYVANSDSNSVTVI